MKYKETLKCISEWIIPPRFYRIFRQLASLRFYFNRELREVLSVNRVFRNIHKGGRCFILGTGPSINKQNLILLKNEACIASSQFYIHKDYSIIKPRYHLLSGLAVHPWISHEVGLKWFREAEEKIISSVLFVNYFDREFIRQNSFFRDREVHYVHFGSYWEVLLRRGINMAMPIYFSQNISVTAIQLALYMGFKKIYLLGLDHDWFLRVSHDFYDHFYQSEQDIFGSLAIKSSRDKEAWFSNLVNLWRQYKALKNFARIREVHIYNATAGGYLDVFDRVDYNSLFK